MRILIDKSRVGVYVLSISISLTRKFQSIYEGNRFFLFFLAFVPTKLVCLSENDFKQEFVARVIYLFSRRLSELIVESRANCPETRRFVRFGAPSVKSTVYHLFTARKKISVPSGGSDRTRSFRIRCLEERRLKIRMFRWLSRKGGVQAGYTRVIDLRHPKMLGSNRASMNSPFFFSLLSLSPFPRLIAAIVLLVRVRCRCVASHRRDPFDRALGFSSVLLPFPISDTSYLISSAATPA